MVIFTLAYFNANDMKRAQFALLNVSMWHLMSRFGVGKAYHSLVLTMSLDEGTAHHSTF